LVCLALGVRSSQQPGTVKAMLALPLPSSRLMLMSMTYPFLRAALDFVIFMAAAFVLGVSAAKVNVPATLAVFVLALGSIGVWGLVSASLTMVVKRGDPVLWIVGTATWLLSGVLYPTNVLPAMLRWLSWLLPTTHALSAMRAAVIDGASWRVMGPDLGALVLFDVIGIPLGLWCYAVAVAYAKRAGTLSHA
jgi:ABC-2 type transport system permease protein